MTIVGTKLGWRLVLGALWVCLGGFVASAQASCGDYVMVGSHAGHGSNDHVTSATGAIAHYPRLPCNGPECSRRPALPDNQPPVVFSTAVQHWGWSVPSILVAPPRPAGDVRNDFCYIELLHPGSVFRPPRPLG